MSHFTYKAKHPGGEIFSGEKDAADRFELYRLIKDSGDEMVEYKEKMSAKGLKMEINVGFLNRVKAVDKINFARNLGLMLESGLALSRALSVIERQTKRPFFKKVIKEIEEEISKGSTFSDALAKHPKVFPPIMSSMSHAGEQSGTLSTSLKSVAAQMEATYNLNRRVRGAMMYPGIILTVMIIIGVLMFVFVVPSLTKVFVELNVELPVTTRFVIGISDAVQNHGIVVALAVAIIIAGLVFWSKKVSGKRTLQSLSLKIPLIGGLVQEVNAARTARTLASLLTAGVNVVESVSITGTVVQNLHYRDVLKQSEEAIKKGLPMSKIFEEHEKLYPIFFAEMLAVGEETGKIGEMLGNVANFYESDVEQKTSNMSTIIEPFLMVVIGAAVGFFAISMISPIYSLVNVVQ